MTTAPTSLRRTGRAVVAATLGLLAGCGWPDGDPSPLRCAALGAPPGAPAPTPADTLEVVLVLDPRTEPLDLLVRVDPLEERGIVGFSPGVPPAAGAAGATVGTTGSFTVCLSGDPGAIVFEGERAPHGKAWARVSTDRPVRAVVRLGREDGVTLEPALVVEPGRSARRRWAPPRGER